MKQYQLFLIDLDGTIYRGKDTIESGVNFVKRLQEKQLDYIFLTNNTTRTPQMVVDKLAGHGVKTDILSEKKDCQGLYNWSNWFVE